MIENGISLNPMLEGLLGASLAFIMFTIALGLKTQDFEFVKTHPTSILTGSLTQLLGLPLLTIALIHILTPAPELALGMLIVACCPGGNMSNLLTRLGRGDTAYSVSLTMVSSLFAAAVLPFAILFWTSLYTPTANLLDTIDVDRAKFILTTTITLLVPLSLGMVLSHKTPDMSLRLNKVFLPISIIILFVVIIGGIMGNFQLFVGHGFTIMPLVILHNGLAFALGALVGFALLRTNKQVRALSFEVGIQNSGLGLLIILTHLNGVGGAAVIVGAWGIWHLIGGFMLVALFRLWDKFSNKPKEVSHGV